MLQELAIKNYALISELKIEFGSGLNILTGETGAGKSVLIGALGMMLGGRATPEMIRKGESEAHIETLWDVSEMPIALKWLEEHGYRDDGSLLIIKRVLSTQGKHRIFINGKNATLGELEELSELVIDLSGQHESQVLLKPDHHRQLLDDDEGIQKVLASYRTQYQSYENIRKELEELKNSEKQKDDKLNFLKFQFNEIEKAALKDESEEEDLAQEKLKLKNSGVLSELASLVSHDISQGSDSIIDRIDHMLGRLDKLSSFDSKLVQMADMLRSARPNLEEVGLFFSDYGRNMNFDPNRLDAIESRLYLISQLKKKYGANISEIKSHLENLKKQIDAIENADELIADKERQIASLSKLVVKEAANLTSKRRERALVLEKNVMKELTTLSMPNVLFKISVMTSESPQAVDCDYYGADEVRFEMAPNKGEGLRPMAQIASGGELSRILLALKLVLGKKNYPISYIFDEVDTGIGGATADAVGNKLSQLSRKNQVLCVTHLPQVASYANQHFVISKEESAGRTSTRIRLVDEKERVREVARMLAGQEVTAKALKNAEEMIEAAKKEIR